MIRSFIAVDLPSEITEKLWKIAAQLNKPGINPVKKENMHITLKFLGNTDHETLDRMAERMETRVSITPFTLEITGIGAFPGDRNPRVIWAGTGEGADNMKQLAGFVENIAGRFGFRKEKRPFVPHSTIARVKRISGESRNIVREVIKKYSNAHFGTFQVDTVRIKKSTLTPAGPIYDDLYTIRLEEVNES